MKCLKHKGLIILGCLLIIVLAITAYRYVNSYRIIELADSDAEVYTVYAAVCPEETSVKELIMTQGVEHRKVYGILSMEQTCCCPTVRNFGKLLC